VCGVSVMARTTGATLLLCTNWLTNKVLNVRELKLRILFLIYYNRVVNYFNWSS